MMLCAGLAAALSFCAATPSPAQSPYPLVPLSISGTLYYTTNNGDKVTGAPLTKVSYTTQSLISLLNASPYASNIIHIVTGKKKIPAMSYFLFDAWNETLTITNANGFSFPLYGHYLNGTNTDYYDFGYIELDYYQLIGSYSQTAKTLAGSETDMTGIYFYFYDGADYETEIEIYGTATLSWTYGKAKNGLQKATVTVTMTGCGNDDCYVQDYDAIPGTFSASGTGSGNIDTSYVPFYWNW